MARGAAGKVVAEVLPLQPPVPGFVFCGGKGGGTICGRGRGGIATSATGSGVSVQHSDTFSDGTVRLTAACPATVLCNDSV